MLFYPNCVYKKTLIYSFFFMTVASFLLDFLSLLVVSYGSAILLLYVFSIFWNGIVSRTVKLLTFALSGSNRS